jgi:hypothetical protein
MLMMMMNIEDKHSCLKRDSNPWSQRVNDPRPTPQTAQRVIHYRTLFTQSGKVSYTEPFF